MNKTQKQQQSRFPRLSTNLTFAGFSLSDDQRLVLTKLIEWLNTDQTQGIRVGGYAGTGKTTLLSLLRKKIHMADKKAMVQFACFTGKASENLRQKLLSNQALFKQDTIGTIHRLMYTPVIDDVTGLVTRWDKKSSIKGSLIIIDEGSMLTKEMWTDLLTYDLRVVVCGDHGQLPPIGDSFSLMANPDLQLEQIHRQSKHNPIINLATKARSGEAISVQRYSAVVSKLKRDCEQTDQLCQDFFSKYDQDCLVLTGTNRLRVQLNHHIRQALNRHFPEPVVGDRVVCLKNIYNNKQSDIYNGMVGTITRLEPHQPHYYKAVIEFADEEKLFSGLILKDQFNQATTQHLPRSQQVTTAPNQPIGLFDYGYALTVHKAQGSEAKKVLLFDESWVFARLDPSQAHKWLYTAITRAQKELYIVSYSSV